MRVKALTLTELAAVNRTSAYQSQRLADHFAKVAIIAADIKKEARHSLRLCQVCFYLSSGFAGQMFTKWKCVLCDTEDTHHNTSVPRMCLVCAATFGLCSHCGGTLDCQQKSRFARCAARPSKGRAK